MELKNIVAEILPDFSSVHLRIITHTAALENSSFHVLVILFILSANLLSLKRMITYHFTLHNKVYIFKGNLYSTSYGRLLFHTLSIALFMISRVDD